MVALRNIRDLQDCESGWESESAPGWHSCSGFYSTAKTETSPVNTWAFTCTFKLLLYSLDFNELRFSVPGPLFESQPPPLLPQHLPPSRLATHGATPKERWTQSRSYDDTCQTEQWGGGEQWGRAGSIYLCVMCGGWHLLVETSNNQ